MMELMREDGSVREEYDTVIRGGGGFGVGGVRVGGGGGVGTKLGVDEEMVGEILVHGAWKELKYRLTKLAGTPSS